MPIIRVLARRASKVAPVALLLAMVGLGLLGFRTDAPAERKAQEIKLLGASVFNPGEHLKYRVHYGFINAGEAELTVMDKVQEQNDRPCYQIEVFGRSVGAFSRIVRIRNVWGTYLDTAWMKPHRAYRDIRENKYRKLEDITFDYAKRVVNVRVKDRRDTSFRIPNPIYDIVSGYFFFRQVDYNRMQEGTVMVLDAFFDNEQYKFKLRFAGRETIKTKYGKIRCLVLSPIMPENSFFDGEDAIKMWVSDDGNRVPIRVSAELAVGSVDLDITDYKGTRTPLMVVRD